MTQASVLTQADRDDLVARYGYLPRMTAKCIRFPRQTLLDLEDLVSEGWIGLLRAAELFDPDRGIKFSTFAIAKIRGAILESLREWDWVPRRVRDNAKRLERFSLDLEIKLGRLPTEEELMEALGLETEAFQKLLVETGNVFLLSLEHALVGNDGNEKLHLSDILEDEDALPGVLAEKDERSRVLSEALQRLPERERDIVERYYWGEQTFKMIGQDFGLSESRIYQLHGEAIRRLRVFLMGTALDEAA